MNINLENIDSQSNSGPNSFGKKLIKYMSGLGVQFNKDKPDAYLCFIESSKTEYDAPLYQRLDGIYFNTDFNYNKQNENIKKTYDISNGVIFQSYFNRELISKYFGSHNNSIIIHNGADLEIIADTPPFVPDTCKNMWSCASSWRPHKRLDENIRFFLEHSTNEDVLMIAGTVPPNQQVDHDNINYLGELSQQELYSLYKGSKYFIHLAWLDHCPNVVVDARACGCKIICSSAGGTHEIAGKDAIIIQEDEWDFEPVKLYDPPPMDFNKKVDNLRHSVLHNEWDNDYNMKDIATRYLDFIRGSLIASNS